MRNAFGLNAKSSSTRGKSLYVLTFRRDVIGKLTETDNNNDHITYIYITSHTLIRGPYYYLLFLPPLLFLATLFEQIIIPSHERVVALTYTYW